MLLLHVAEHVIEQAAAGLEPAAERVEIANQIPLLPPDQHVCGNAPPPLGRHFQQVGPVEDAQQPQGRPVSPPHVRLPQIPAGKVQAQGPGQNGADTGFPCAGLAGEHGQGALAEAEEHVEDICLPIAPGPADKPYQVGREVPPLPGL